MPFFNYIGAETMSMGEKWATSGITTLIGLGMTFAILALLIGTILLLRLILKELEKLISKKKATVEEPEAQEEIAPSAPPAEEPIDEDTMKAIEEAVLNYVKKDNNFVAIKAVSRASSDEDVVVEEAPQNVPSIPTTIQSSGKGKAINAPMPGTILKIVATNGKPIKEGDAIFVLEAMKMENEIVSPVTGIFHATVAEGAKVNTGDLIAEIQ